MTLLHSDLCLHVISSERAILAILPQTYKYFFVHFLFSYFAFLFFTVHIVTLHYIFSCVFITDLLPLIVNSMESNLELFLAYSWCLNSVHSGSSVIFIEWKKPFWKSSLQVNCYDHVTSGSKQTSQKGSLLEWKGDWNRREENPVSSLAAWVMSLWENNSTLLELSFLIVK